MQAKKRTNERRCTPRLVLGLTSARLDLCFVGVGKSTVSRKGSYASAPGVEPHFGFGWLSGPAGWVEERWRVRAIVDRYRATRCKAISMQRMNRPTGRVRDA